MEAAAVGGLFHFYSNVNVAHDAVNHSSTGT
jgi:hypothetical protein